MQCHPVYFLFPTCPVPIWHGIAIGHRIEVIVMLVRGDNGFRRAVLHLVGPFQPLAAPGRNTCLLRFDILVKTTASSHSAAGIHIQHAILDRRFEHIVPVLFVKRYGYPDWYSLSFRITLYHFHCLLCFLFFFGWLATSRHEYDQTQHQSDKTFIFHHRIYFK